MWKFLIAWTVLCTTSCAGAKNRLSFDGSRYPVSNSHYVSAADGSSITHPRLERVGTFTAKGRGWAIFFMAIPLGPIDLSEELNRQVAAAGGDAVSGLKVEVTSPMANYLWPLTWIPFFPGSVVASVEGAIVRDTERSGP